MLISQAYPSKYIKSADLAGKTVQVVISHVELEEVEDGEFKPIMYFQGKDRGLVVNKTNAEVIASAYGDETDAWLGQAIVLFSRLVEFRGKQVPGLRVRMPQPSERQQQMRVVNSPDPAPVNRQQAPAARASAATYHAADVSTDDVPF